MPIHCTVVTPEATAVDIRAQFVSVPLSDGEKGILSGHAPMIGRLGAGELRLRTPERTIRYFIDGGFVQVADDEVSIMTSRAIAASELDAAAIREQLQSVREKPAHRSDLMEQREQHVGQLRAQLRVAQRLS